MVTIELKYRVYRNENGLLIEPTYGWGGKIYKLYDSVDEALVDILDFNGDDLIILPVAISCWSEE